MREYTRECARACVKWGRLSRGTGEEGMKPRKERSRWGGRSADESANENSKKRGDFEKPPSFCIMSVNRMLFLGGEGVKS